jgi:hypothetical protein
MGALNLHFVTKHPVLEGLLLIKYGKMVAIATSLAYSGIVAAIR